MSHFENSVGGLRVGVCGVGGRVMALWFGLAGYSKWLFLKCHGYY